MARRNPELMREEQLRKIESLMEEIARLAPGCGLSNEDLMEMFSILHLEE